MPVIPHKAKTATAVPVMSSAAPSLDSLINMLSKKRPKLNRGRPNPVLRARRESQGDFDTIDMDETASILGKSTKTLQRWREIGYGPPFELDGRYVSYSRAEVEAWKAEHGFKRTPSAYLGGSVKLSSGHSEA